MALALVAVLGAFAPAAGVGAVGPGADPGADDAPSRLLVTAREFALTLSRPKVEAGDAIVEMYDFGEDPHDLKLQRVGGPTIYSMAEVLPGETGRLDLRLRRASRYRLWCSLPNHADLGMFASLRTSRN